MTCSVVLLQVAVSQFASMPGDDNNVSQVAHCRIILQNVNVPTSRDGGVNSSVMLSAIVVACLCFVILIVVAILACKVSARHHSRRTGL